MNDANATPATELTETIVTETPVEAAPKVFHKVVLTVYVPYTKEVIVEADDEDDAMALALENYNTEGFVAGSIDGLDPEIEDVFEVDEDGVPVEGTDGEEGQEYEELPDDLDTDEVV